MSTRLGNRGGVIINIASAAGLAFATQPDKIAALLCCVYPCFYSVGLFPMSQAPVYTATKHAVIGFSRALKVSRR